MIQKQDLRYFQEKQILVASIDIGTNSTHLLVAEINLELKSFSIKFTDKSTTRLGERDEEGNLTEESIQRALVTLKRFKEYCKSNGVKQIVTAATSAVREAPNGQDFIRRVLDETELDITEGMSFDRGYSSPYFVTDQERQVCELENPKILITDQKVSTLVDLVPILEEIQKSGSPFLILAEDIEGEALTTLVLNKNSGVLNVASVRAPLFGERRKAALEDIAILTGAKLISEDKSMTLDKVSINDLGKAKKITITKDKTTIVAYEDTKDLVKARVEKLKREVNITESEYDQDKINERIAKLAGGVALIKVGAATETEMKYKKLRIEDSLNATKAAIEEGVVSGGGQTLIEISDDLLNLSETSSDDLRTGINIVKEALLEPTKQIAKNAGFNGDVVVAEIKRLNKGFNANSGKYEDLKDSGILDPTKVIRLALQDSVSIAAMLLTTEVAMADIPEPEAAAPGGPGGDPMGGMGGMGMPGMGGMGMPGMGGMGMPGMGGMGMPGMGGMGMPGMM